MLPEKTLRHNHGHSLLELLLVVSITGIITGVGGHMLQVLLMRQQADIAMKAEAERYQLMISSLQFAYDSRCLNPFSGEPWMRIKTGGGDAWYPLHRLEITIIEKNTPVQWVWNAPGLTPVLVNVPTGSYLSDQYPQSLRFKFPASSLPVPREGIAIEGIPETVLLEE